MTSTPQITTNVNAGKIPLTRSSCPNRSWAEVTTEAWDIKFGDVRESMIRIVYWGVTGPKVPRR